MLSREFMEEVTAGFVPVAVGAALPHIRLAGLDHPEMLLVRLHGGLATPDPDGAELTPGAHEELRAMFFLVSPQEKPGQHLRLLGHLATHVDDPGFLDLWMGARNELELRESLLREERSLTVWVRGDRASADWIGRPVRDLELPRNTLVALIRRDGSGLVPDGSSVIREDDHLVIIGNPGPIATLAQTLGRG
jgi:mannitol/fructose-specific phosphotransferase system IIA component (Ntr-type)